MTTILGFDPGRGKCGVAVVRDSSGAERVILHHDVVAAELALSAIAALVVEHGVTQLVLGDQTSSREWRGELEEIVKLPIALVDERNSTLEARDRYWKMYPAALSRLTARMPPRLHLPSAA